MRQKHFSFTLNTKSNKRVDLTKIVYRALEKSGFTNGLITLYTPYPTCSIVLEAAGGAPRDLGVSFTVPFFGGRPLLQRAHLFLFDADQRSVRRKIHVLVVGE